MPDRSLTVMFTDMKGYTARTANASRGDLMRLLRDHDHLVLPVLELRGGILIKTIGDALMMKFSSARHAVLAAMEAQQALRAHNLTLDSSDRIDIRIGIHTGEVTEVDGDLFGNTVNVAARVESMASAGTVTFSEAVYAELPPGLTDVVDMGRHSLKGVPVPVRVFKVREPGWRGKLDAWAWRFRSAAALRWSKAGARGLGLAGCTTALVAAAALTNTWLACVSALMLVGLVPYGKGWIRKGRWAALGLAVALGIASGPKMWSATEDRLDVLSSEVRRRGPSALTFTDRVGLYLLHLGAASASLVVGDLQGGQARLALHLPNEGARRLRSDFPMDFRKVRRPVSSFASRLSLDPRRKSQMMRPASIDLRSDRELGSRIPMHQLRLKGKAQQDERGWVIDVTAEGKVGHSKGRRYKLFDAVGVELDVDGALFASLERAGWLFPYTRRWVWSLSPDDRRLVQAVGSLRP